jgi:hypothetical protein
MGSSHAQSLRKDKRAVSPAISTVILTAAVVVMILVAMGFANTFLDARMAENEFSTNKQFMLTTGLQIDDIAWTIGRTQTVRYSSKYGNMKFLSPALNYSFYVDFGDGVWVPVFSEDTGMILFNIPVSTYSISNNYFERVMPSSNGSFLQEGPSAPVTHVFCVEKLPMKEGNYTRIVAVPSIRMLTSSIDDPSGTSKSYTKFYLPALERGDHLYRSQSITMTGKDITKVVRSGAYRVRINVTFSNGMPDSTQGFDYDFFNFDHTIDNYHASETVTLPDDSVVEFYVGKVIVTLGKV